MKCNKSPQHRLIQLRRRTQKLPTNSFYKHEYKQNIFNQSKQSQKITSKSKSHLSKNNSLEKHNFNKKKIAKSSNDQKKSKQFKNPNRFIQTLTKKLNQMHKPSLLSYQAHLDLNKVLLSQIKCNNDQEKELVDLIGVVLQRWIRYSQLVNTNKLANFESSYKNMTVLEGKKKQSEELKMSCGLKKNSGSIRRHSFHFQDGLNDLSSFSLQNSYIQDPKIQITLKPIDLEMKKQLQLNFSKIDEIRKKQLM